MNKKEGETKMKKKYVMVLLTIALMVGTVGRQTYAAEETFEIQDEVLDEALDEMEESVSDENEETEETEETVPEQEEELEETVPEQEEELNETVEPSMEETNIQDGWDEEGNSYYEDGQKVEKDWRKIDGYWYWFDVLGNKAADQDKYGIDGAYYAFDAQGHMRKGWVQAKSGDWYYAGNNGKLYQTQWLQSGSYWYYFNADGKMVSDDNAYYAYTSNSGGTYAFDKNGHMKTGWIEQKKSVWNYFGTSGKRLENQWLQIGSYWYYFNEDGLMIANDNAYEIEKRETGISTYAFDKNGHMRTGWFQPEKNIWNYFGSNGKRLEDQWLKYGKYWYYLQYNGAMVCDETNTYIDKAWYSFDKNGHMRKGWVNDNNSWFYFNSNGKAASGVQKINQYVYSFYSYGLMQRYTTNTDGKYLYYFGEYGRAESQVSITIDGWKKLEKPWGKVWYYVKNKKLVKNQFLKVNGSWYYFDAEGEMVTGECFINGEIHQFDKNGVWKGKK